MVAPPVTQKAMDDEATTQVYSVAPLQGLRPSKSLSISESNYEGESFCR